MIHGGFGSAAQAQRAYGWNDMADAHEFIVAYPDGKGRAWNGGSGCCGDSGKIERDDVQFIVQMIDVLALSLPIDQSRIYATGMSNGGIMSYRLACETNRFAAIAPVAGTQLVPCVDPTPTSVLAIHGVDDASVRFDGEPGSGVAKIDGPPVRDVMAFWRDVNNCSGPIEATIGDVTDSYAACPEGRVVELLAIANMEHTWPGGGSGPIAEMRTNHRGGDDFIATVVIWEFFANKVRTI
jgi:polyhydroxybutyrate depolymerase